MYELRLEFLFKIVSQQTIPVKENHNYQTWTNY